LKQIKKSQRLHGFKADMLRPYTFILRRRNGINIIFCIEPQFGTTESIMTLCFFMKSVSSIPALIGSRISVFTAIGWFAGSVVATFASARILFVQGVTYRSIEEAVRQIWGCPRVEQTKGGGANLDLYLMLGDFLECFRV